MDLTTQYLGLPLKNPLVAAASPLSRTLDTARRLEDAGAGAIVMYSLFEEEILDEEQALLRFLKYQDIGDPEASTYRPVPASFKSALERYLDQLAILKSRLQIPIIASLNGVTPSGWVHYGKDLQEAGADALELNAYHVSTDPEESSAAVEERYLALLRNLRREVTIPVAMKLSAQFSALPNFVQRLQGTGAAGVVLFNRFYHPSINLRTLRIEPSLSFSTPADSLLAIRWIGILRSQVQFSLAATGGVHTTEEVIKMILAGADVTQLCAILLKRGPNYLSTLLSELTAWMTGNEYESISQMKGSVSQIKSGTPVAFEHANYMKVLDSYAPSSL